MMSERKASRPSRYVRTKSLEPAKAKLKYLLKTVGFETTDLNLDIIAKATIREYLEAYQREPSHSTRLSPLTIEFTKSKVHEIINCGNRQRATVYDLVRTAKIISRNQGLTFRLFEENGQLFAERQPDFQFYKKRKELSQTTKVLVEMEIGESRLVEYLIDPSQVSGTHKKTARRILNNPNASWTCRLTSKGYRIRRVS